MIPAMIREKYDRGHSAAVLATACGLGIVLPPSIPLIIYGVLTNALIGDLVLAGVTLMPVVMLGGIYGGIFTPTEAAAVAVAYSALLTLFYLGIRWKHLPSMFKRTFFIARISLITIAAVSTYGHILTIEQVPATIAGFLDGLAVPNWIILFVIVLLLLFIGMFMETLAGIILWAPILLPVTQAMGMDPIHFGIVMIMASMIGFATPPVGDNLNVASAISGLPTERVSISALPFVAALTCCCSSPHSCRRSQCSYRTSCDRIARRSMAILANSGREEDNYVRFATNFVCMERKPGNSQKHPAYKKYRPSLQNLSNTQPLSDA